MEPERAGTVAPRSCQGHHPNLGLRWAVYLEVMMVWV